MTQRVFDALENLLNALSDAEHSEGGYVYAETREEYTELCDIVALRNEYARALGIAERPFATYDFTTDHQV